jgi:hypothetical protein
MNPTSGSNFLQELLVVKDALRNEQRKNQQPQLYYLPYSREKKTATVKINKLLNVSQEVLL